jgi:integrase
MQKARDAGQILTRKTITVADLLNAHLESRALRVRPSTLRNLEILRDHIVRRVGDEKITQVRVTTVQQLIDAMEQDGMSPERVSVCLQLLHKAFEKVIPDQVSHNPVNRNRLDLSRIERAHEPEPLTPEDVRRLLTAADDLEARGAAYRYGIAWWLAVLLGLRRGELAGLMWQDLDWTTAELSIRRAASRNSEGKYTPGETKTPGSKRTLPVGPRLLARLRQQWDLHQAERAHYGPARQEHGYILCRMDGKYIHPHALNNRLRTLCRDEAFPHWTIHLFRHTFATCCEDAGFNQTIIGSLLGHEKRGRSTTRRYTHARQQARRAAIAAVEDLIFSRTEEAKEATP